MNNVSIHLISTKMPTLFLIFEWGILAFKGWSWECKTKILSAFLKPRSQKKKRLNFYEKYNKNCVIYILKSRVLQSFLPSAYLTLLYQATFRNQFLIIQFLQTLIFPTYQCEKEKEKKWKMFLEKNINFQLPENSVYKKENNALLR